MLSSPDADLCRRDPALPGLATLLDPDLLKARVAEAGGSLPLEHFVPGYLRYKPETNCIVGFDSPDSSQTVAFYGKVYSPKSGKPKPSQAHHATRRGQIILDSDNVELFVFPADGRLELADVLNRKAALSLSVQTERHVTTERNGSLTTLSYRPERRCVFAEEADKLPVAVIKAYSTAEFSRTLPRARALAALHSTAFPVLAAEDEANRFLVFSWMPGEVIQSALESGSPSSSELIRAGQQLAALHRVHVPALPARTNEDDADHLRQIAAMIGRLWPDLTERAAAAARRITGELMTLPADACTLHGDFGAKQIVAQEESISFVDFDETARGNAATDLGNFIARLHADVLWGKIPSDAIEPTRTALLSGYESVRKLPSERELALCSAAGLFRVALEPFRRHEPDWPARIPLYIDGALALLDNECDPAPVAAAQAMALR